MRTFPEMRLHPYEKTVMTSPGYGMMPQGAPILMYLREHSEKIEFLLLLTRILEN